MPPSVVLTLANPSWLSAGPMCTYTHVSLARNRVTLSLTMPPRWQFSVRLRTHRQLRERLHGRLADRHHKLAQVHVVAGRVAA